MSCGWLTHSRSRELLSRISWRHAWFQKLRFPSHPGDFLCQAPLFSAAFLLRGQPLPLCDFGGDDHDRRDAWISLGGPDLTPEHWTQAHPHARRLISKHPTPSCQQRARSPPLGLPPHQGFPRQWPRESSPPTSHGQSVNGLQVLYAGKGLWEMEFKGKLTWVQKGMEMYM